jgi:hypothetical protein
MKKNIGLLLLLLPSFSKAQVNLQIEKYDTVYARSLTVKKIVAYKHGELTIYLDFIGIEQQLNMLSEKGRYNYQVARKIQERLKAEIFVNDTALLDQQDFIKINWVPFDDWLCAEIRKGNCIVKDNKGIIHSQFILGHATRRNDRYYVWGGILFFLPGQKEPFIEETEWEN